MYQNLTSDISQSRPHTSSIFMSFSIKSGTQNSKMEWKPEPDVVFHAILAKNQISRFFRPRILMIRLCLATMRPADQSVDRRRFGPPPWTGNRTAMPRRTDSDHAECSRCGSRSLHTKGQFWGQKLAGPGHDRWLTYSVTQQGIAQRWYRCRLGPSKWAAHFTTSRIRLNHPSAEMRLMSNYFDYTFYLALVSRAMQSAVLI